MRCAFVSECFLSSAVAWRSPVKTRSCYLPNNYSVVRGVRVHAHTLYVYATCEVWAVFTHGENVCALDIIYWQLWMLHVCTYTSTVPSSNTHIPNELAHTIIMTNTSQPPPPTHTHACIHTQCTCTCTHAWVSTTQAPLIHNTSTHVHNATHWVSTSSLCIHTQCHSVSAQWHVVNTRTCMLIQYITSMTTSQAHFIH